MLVDSDPQTIDHSNLVLTRIKIAVPNKEVIPACQNLVFTDENGATSTYLVLTMVEDDDSDQPWGYFRTQLFSLNRKRQRSPSPPPPPPPKPFNPILSFQPTYLHLG